MIDILLLKSNKFFPHATDSFWKSQISPEYHDDDDNDDNDDDGDDDDENDDDNRKEYRWTWNKTWIQNKILFCFCHGF